MAVPASLLQLFTRFQTSLPDGVSGDSDSLPEDPFIGLPGASAARDCIVSNACFREMQTLLTCIQSNTAGGLVIETSQVEVPDTRSNMEERSLFPVQSPFSWPQLIHIACY